MYYFESGVISVHWDWIGRGEGVQAGREPIILQAAAHETGLGDSVLHGASLISAGYLGCGYAANSRTCAAA